MPREITPNTEASFRDQMQAHLKTPSRWSQGILIAAAVVVAASAASAAHQISGQIRVRAEQAEKESFDEEIRGPINLPTEHEVRKPVNWKPEDARSKLEGLPPGLEVTLSWGPEGWQTLREAMDTDVPEFYFLAGTISNGSPYFVSYFRNGKSDGVFFANRWAWEEDEGGCGLQLATQWRIYGLGDYRNEASSFVEISESGLTVLKDMTWHARMGLHNCPAEIAPVTAELKVSAGFTLKNDRDSQRRSPFPYTVSYDIKD